MTDLSSKSPITVPLEDLFVAPENIRSGDDVDDGIDDLASSLKAGQIQPLFVRAAPGMLRPWAVLDGRRRMLALQSLAEADVIAFQHPVQVVVCETPEEIAAATVITNAERLEITHADYLISVHRLTKEFKSVDDIARILGLESKKVRQLAKLGSVDRRFLNAYKAEDIKLPTLRKLSKVNDPEQIEQYAHQLEQGYLNEYSISSASRDALRADSPLAQLITLDAYVAAGGTIEQDLFEEAPDQLTDVALANQLWADVSRPIADHLREQGLTVTVNPDTSGLEGHASMPWNWKLREGNAEAYAALETEAKDIARTAAETRANGDPGWVEHGQASVITQLKLFNLKADPLTAKGVRLSPAAEGDRCFIGIRFYLDTEELEAHLQAARELEAKTAPTTAMTSDVVHVQSPVVETVVDVAGFQHLLHERVTSIAGTALAVSLAKSPSAAFDLQLATQFKQIMVDRYSGEDRLLKVSTSRSLPDTNNALMAGIREQLVSYRTAFREANVSPLSWVQSLADAQRGDLFALLTAIQIDTREQKTNSIRLLTRAEAAQIADALDYDVRDVWTPPVDFWVEFSKKQLLGYLKAMGCKTAEHEKLKREELAPVVAEKAKEHDWVLPQLNFELVDPAVEDDETDDGSDQVGDEAEVTKLETAQ